MKRRLPAVALFLALLPAAAHAVTQEEANHVLWNVSGGLSSLRLLDADSHLYEFPTHGMIIRLGTQFVPVKLDNGEDYDLSHVNFALGFGWEKAKFLLLADILSLSDSIFPHSGSKTIGARGSVMLALPITPNKFVALTPAFSYNGPQSSGGAVPPPGMTATYTWLLRARVYGVKAQIAFAPGGATVVGALSPVELIGAFAGDLSDRLLSTIGNPELLFEHYEAGSVPYALSLTSPAENNYGARWETPQWIPHGFFHATVLGGTRTGALDWRRLELGYKQIFHALDHRLLGAMSTSDCITSMCPVSGVVPFLGIWSPGATLLSVDTKAFALNMDDKMRVGFSAALRMNFMSNNTRMTPGARGRMNELALWYEGEDSEHVSLYFEARLARNDFHSIQGLPLEDLTTFGLWFGSENLTTDVDTPGIGRAQRNALNEALDGNPDYLPDERRQQQLEGVKTELKHSAGAAKPPAPSRGLSHGAPAGAVPVIHAPAPKAEEPPPATPQ